MTTAPETADSRVTTVNTASQSYGALVWRRFRKSVPGMIGLVLVTALLVIAIFAPFFAPMDPKAAGAVFAPPTGWPGTCPATGPRPAGT